MFVGLGQAEKGILFLLQERGGLCVADVLAAYPGVQPKSCRRAMRSLSSKGFGRLSETPVLTLAIDDKRPAPARKAARTSRRGGEPAYSRKFSPDGRGDGASSSGQQSCSPVEEPIDAEFREISTGQESLTFQHRAAHSSGRTQLAHPSGLAACLSRPGNKQLLRWPCHADRACGLAGGQVARGMKKISYKGYRFPLKIIQQAIWLYVRFTLSFRDVEDLLAERGIMVSYETVRRWVNHFGPMIAANLRKRRPKPD